MPKKESLLKLALSLTLITAVAGIALAAVFSVTEKPIEEMKLKKKNDAIKLVLPQEFDGTIETPVEYILDGDQKPVIIHPAFQEDKLFAVAVETYTDKAFSGSFSIMVGLDIEGTVLGSEILEHSETPGLGDKINKKKSDFPNQFVGKNLNTSILKVKKDNGDIDAITAATISSRSYCDAVNRAYSALKIYLENNNQSTNKEEVLYEYE